jgi:hypothetical protein
MSCILYTWQSYRELAARPTFHELWRDLFASTYYESPEDFAEALFKLNVRAYCDRYKVEGREESDDAQSAMHSEHGGEFSEYLTADTATLEPFGVAKLWAVFSRIEYQCSDAEDANELQTYWHLTWAKDWCARHLCARVEQQHETQRASVRRVLAHLAGLNGSAEPSRIAGDIRILERYAAEANA